MLEFLESGKLDCVNEYVAKGKKGNVELEIMNLGFFGWVPDVRRKQGESEREE